MSALRHFSIFLRDLLIRQRVTCGVLGRMNAYTRLREKLPTGKVAIWFRPATKAVDPAGEEKMSEWVAMRVLRS
jgi:hypothetical protein